MNRRTSYLEPGLWIAGGCVAIYVLVFAILWCDSFVWKTQYSNALPPQVREFLRIAYSPIIYPLDKLGLIP